MRKLVIDLGHGGYDPGAVGQGGTKESDILLKLGQYLDTILKGIDLDVRFTRMSDRYVSLSDRVKFANTSGCEYFLSIHINSCGDGSVRGSEVFMYSSSDKKFNGFCESLCDDVSSILKVRNRGIKNGKDLYVLKHTFMKACLLEIDFISNKDCEKALKDEENLRCIAKAIKSNILKLYDISEKSEVLYKVCIGTYKDKSNAINTMKIAKDRGFSDAYII